MTRKKTILRELSRQHEATGGEYTRRGSIPGFSQQPEKYQKAVNELLTARLVSGHKDDDGHMTIALNGGRLKEVKRELRPVWAHPAVWVAVVLALVLTAVTTGIV
jgi:hypothetical protein